MAIKKEKKALVFETTIPVFSWFVAKGMGVVVLIILAVFGFITAFTIKDGGTFESLTPDIYHALGFVGLIFFFTYVVMALIFPKGFVSKISISESGISQVSLSPTKHINRVAIIGGVLTKSPGAVGTGLLAEAGDDRTLLWKEITIAHVNTKDRYMYFSKGKFGLYPIGFFCPEKKYKATEELLKKYFPKIQIII